MDQQSNNIQVELKRLFDELAFLGNISEQQKQDLFVNLEKAIVINISGKLVGQLPEDDKKVAEQKEFRTSEDLFEFLSSKVSRDDFLKIAGSSVEEVVKNFLGKI